MAIGDRESLFGCEFKSSINSLHYKQRNLLKYAKEFWSNHPISTNVQLQKYLKKVFCLPFSEIGNIDLFAHNPLQRVESPD